MNKPLLSIFFSAFFFFSLSQLYGQINQTVANGDTAKAENFSGAGCIYNWVNSDPSIGLPASGTGNIASFKTINTGTSPVTATITATPVPTGFAYVTNFGDATVTVVNTATNSVVATINANATPLGISHTPDGKKVYVTNEGPNKVSVIDVASNTLTATIPVGNSPWGICISPDGSHVYVANEGENTMSVISTATNTVVNTVNVGISPWDVSASPDGKHVYVAYGVNAIAIVNTATNTVSGNISLDTGSAPHSMCVSPDGSKLYVANGDLQSVSVVDLATNTVTADINVGSFPYGMCISADGRRLYVANNYSSNISVINLSDNSVTTIPIGGPTGVSLNADGSRLYATCDATDELWVINTATNAVESKIPTGLYPTSLGNFVTTSICNGSATTFTITVNAASAPPSITASPVTGNISACTGTASASPSIQQFTVSGSNLTAAVTATAPPGFEVSLASASGYGSSVTLNPVNDSLSNATVYVRSATTATTGNISGNVTLSSTGAENQTVAVTGIVNPLPTIGQVADQTVANGSATTAVNFNGTGNTVFNWVNDTPGIGLPATGSGNIGQFTAVNTGTSPVTATITATPVSEGFAYITNSGDGTISVINVATNTIVATVTPPHDPACVCISPDGSKAYIGCSDGSSTVTVINTLTNAIINTIPVSSSGESTGIVVTPDGSTLYVANYVDNTVTAVNTVTGAVVAVIPVGQNPYGIAITPDGSKVYVALTYSSYISVISTATNTVTASITVGVAAPDVAVSPDGSKVYVPVTNSDHIAVIDPVTNNITAVIPTGASPGVICLNTDGTRIYVATGLNIVSVINTSTNMVIATVTVGSAPNGICVSPDGNFVYVTNTESKTVSVISTSTNTVIATINVGIEPLSLGNFVTAGTGCTGVPTTFTITVKPTLAPTPAITADNTSGSIYACAGTASASPNILQFTVSGSNLTADVTATAPTGFELSLAAGSGYGSSFILSQSAGSLNSTTVYVRSAAGDGAGNISGEVVLSSAGATDISVPVRGIINALPAVNTVAAQTLVSGATSTAVNFTGTANTYNWVNDTPGIGLATSGIGDITPFAVINNTNNPVTATITVTPLNSTNCSGIPVEFTITVTPAPAVLTAAATLTSLTTIYGTASAAESFTVSGKNIASAISVSPPAGFEVSSDGTSFNNTASISGAGSVSSAQVFIRLASTTPVGDYSGNIVLSTGNAAGVNVAMPVSTVTPAPLTITADNQTKPYGADNPALTVTYTGFVNNDGPAQLTAQPEVTTTATSLSPVGQYPIVAGNAASPNYNFTYIPGVLTITPSLSLMSIPNTFTPNGDGINDTWVVQGLEYYPGLTLNVFSRWGQKLFSSVGYPVPWDGKYLGRPLPTGTYYYIIDPKNGQAVIAGWVAIVR